MEKDIKAIIKKRMYMSFILVILIFVLLSFRLYYLQIKQGDHLKLNAIKQRGREFSIYPERGPIFDRHTRPITNNEVESTAIIEKKDLADNALYNRVLSNTSLSRIQLNQLIRNSTDLVQIPLDRVEGLENQGNVFIVDVVKRYSKGNPLAHVVGYINQSENRGKYGIELIHDEFLRNSDKSSFVLEYDRDRKMILGGTYYVNRNIDPNSPSGVKLTVDLELQKEIEKIMDKFQMNGAVIINQIADGEILALASRPNFNQEKIEEYIDNGDMTFFNKAVQVSYPPGSLFKIVVLLTALEEEPEVLKDKYSCKGYEIINGIQINCSSTHGQLDLKEAFAKSCNSVFIQIGKEIGANRVIKMAEKLGFGSTLGIGLLEKGGILPKRKELFGAAIGNISIGQDKLEVTPLQISNLLTIIANKGIRKDLSIIKGITNKEGVIIKAFQKGEDVRLISTASTELLLEYLKEVVSSGTARSMEVYKIGGAGGKTGSAQATFMKKATVHGWFSGFYPANDPKYIITVLVEDTELGSTAALPIFEEIVKSLYEY